MARRTVRVLLAMSGEDGHDRGAKVLALALRDAGMEVIYTGLSRMAEQVAAAAVQENVDVVALCAPRGVRPPETRALLDRLAALGLRDGVRVAVAGAVSSRDAARLRKMGVDGVFPSGTPDGDIAAWIGASTKNGNERGTG